MEYDRLNYTPPANKWKPHYQRMTNGFPAAAAGSVATGSRAESPTPPIPPLPKLNIAPPPPPKRDEEPLDVPEPPKRDELPPPELTLTPSDEENDAPLPWHKQWVKFIDN